MDRILVTGAAGFVGSHVCRHLLNQGCRVVGIDNLSPYYDVALKEARRNLLLPHPGFAFQTLDILDREGLEALFARERPTRVVHLAAQVGVRYSLTHPHAYVDANVTGFLNVLEACRCHDVQHLVYASSSSVYGALTRMPYSVHDHTDHPLSLYAATKKADELMAHTYAHLYRLPVTGLRFFTVYGPWGRPDMSYYLFAKAMVEGRPIDLFGEGHLRRDFTFVEDIANGVARVLDHIPAPDPAWSGDDPDAAHSKAPYALFNIGNHQPVEVLRVVEILERHLGVEAIRNLLPPQPGDVEATWADVDDLARAVGWRPVTDIEEGLARFVAWFRDYHGL